jgi:Polyketide cyclase / dehydrase and lipid transport
VALDIRTEIVIDRPCDDVAVAADPDKATAWYENIKAVVWKSPRPLATGAEIAFTAAFLGRTLAYTYTVTELVPGERLVMTTTENPFPMETTYTWEDTPAGGTRMTLRNRGEPSGFGRLTTPVLSLAMRRAKDKDLKRLRDLLESSGSA